MKKLWKFILGVVLLFLIFLLGVWSYDYYTYINSFEQKIKGTTWTRPMSLDDVDNNGLNYKFGDGNLQITTPDGRYKENGDYFISDPSYIGEKPSDSIPLNDIISEFRENFSSLKSKDITEEDLVYIDILPESLESGETNHIVGYKGVSGKIYALSDYTKKNSSPLIFYRSVDSKIVDSYKLVDAYNTESTEEEDRETIKNFEVLDVNKDSVTIGNFKSYIGNYDDYLKDFNSDNIKSRKMIKQLLRNQGYQLDENDPIYVLNNNLFFIPVENGKKMFVGSIKNDPNGKYNNLLLLFEKLKLKN